eukprot:CAMPEP_0177683250 /NCGR_PEP_ID=MMETSP0447-20121125/31688_1 /TAXON_ID=0 /ORGANISM="Stygamoeba regulata, Strain BSH-02190019" /LENGTH=72 /DNA_ID=CAMNT_0019192799 /DNA_START=38 /DNA_END=256 /DNA_ORIENTATION=+
MSAIFNFQSLCVVVLLLICTCAYLHMNTPLASFMDRNKDGSMVMFWRFARIGERLSPWVSLACIAMGVWLLM